jgi:acyl-CoA thioester hydrolase
MNQPIVETELRVRYAETDAMGVVYHANYLVWFEVGRGDFFRAMGQDYGHWEQRGYLLPVSEAHARYHAPARFGERIIVRTWVEQVRSRSLTLGYQVVHAESQERLVTGWTKHICMDREGRARRLPQEMLDPLESTPASEGKHAASELT